MDMVIYHIDMVISHIDMGDDANDMGDDSIDTVISHIDMGYLVTLDARTVPWSTPPQHSGVCFTYWYPSLFGPHIHNAMCFVHRYTM